MSDGIPNDGDRVDAALKELGEHFDSVMIFTTRHESTEAGTHTVAKGVGNWYARFGQVVEWVDKENEIARAEARNSL